jgi:signal transduction histidine kinase/CheY-like chemotaxis protein
VVVLAVAAISALSAFLMWEVEHVGSVTFALVIAAAAVVACGLILRQIRGRLDQLAEHYGSLLRLAEEQFQRAETANRLKEEFLATLSHELRTPLNIVLGWTRLLANGKLTPEQSARAIAAVERAGWAQSRLIEDLLDVSRLASGKVQLTMRTTAIDSILDRVIESLGAAAEAKSIVIEAVVDPAVGAIRVDADRLQQILWNLISNAIKFTPALGHVSVKVERHEGSLRMRISDTGIGFDHEVAAHLFERFRQGDSSTTRPYGGLGLGLGIVRHLVELHGGTVTAYSAGLNAGSSFDVTLPVPLLPADSIVEPEAISESAQILTGLSVLLVDDDPESLAVAVSSLERYGARVTTACSGAEAREWLRRQHPDVLVSDLRMPDEDGLQLIRDIRRTESAARLPAAALTALARSDDRRDALAAGYQAHVTKPVDPYELAATVAWLAHGNPGARTADMEQAGA